LTYLLVSLASGAAAVLAGTALARLADRSADATGLGRIWIGSILLATATSLPELVTDVAAVRLEAVDLAVGDLFGSSMAKSIRALGAGGRVEKGSQVRHRARSSCNLRPSPQILGAPRLSHSFFANRR